MSRLSILLLGSLLVGSACRTYRQDLPTYCQMAPVAIDAYTKANRLIPMLDSLLVQGVPGVAMAVWTDEGSWEYAGGWARLEDQIPMQTCHLHYLQSISKTYMAVGILQLWEEGRIELDAPITTYLPEELSRHFPAAGQVTVRMLLNHTSGLPEYNQDPYYVTTLLQHPDRFFAPEEYLQYISGKPLRFAPGSRFAYTNTNYELLALIADQITGDHAAYLTEKIFQPLGLTRTFYRHEDAYLTYPALYNAYWDRYSNGIVENVSRMQRTNVASMIGDDGLVCTPRDAVRFLRGLMEGKLLQPETLAMMQEWVKDEDGTLRYGLGLDHTLFHGQAGYGHSGGGLGAGCELYYLPANNTYFFLGINLGTVTASPIHRAAEPALEAIHAILAE